MPNRIMSVALFGVALLTGPLARGLVYETPTEFLTTGDFNGDGQTDVVLVDRYSGRVRIGYQTAPGSFNWVNRRAGGLKDVTAVTVGKLADSKRDTLAFASADVNLVTVLDAPDPSVPTAPVVVPSTVLGPNTVVALDVGGAGNTPLDDLIVGSIYNSAPENRVTFYRNDGRNLAQMAELPAGGAGAHANRIALQRGGPEFGAVLLGGEAGSQLVVGSLASGEPKSVLTIRNVPAGADYVVGYFRGEPQPEFIFYTSGESNLQVAAVTAAGGGQFTAGVLKSVNLSRPVRQLVVVDDGKKSRLLAVFGEGEPAELLDFDTVNPPVLAQPLAGATNKVLSAAISLPDAVVLFSSLMPGRAATHYQVYSRADGKFVAGNYGGLASLADTDDSTVADIHKRIVAAQTEKTAADMKPYTNAIPGTEVPYAMVTIPGGEFVMGSPATEKDRKPDEGPQHPVKISPFWMGAFEITWDQYLLFMYPDDERKLRETRKTDADANRLSDAVTRPSKPYVDMSFGMGKSGFPAIAMTQHGANKFCHWLSAKTGHFYRLPTEAEWEYACRAGTTTAHFFGEDTSKLGDYGWFFDNSNSKYQKVGKKKPNPWGLFDIYGNVTEWTLDQYAADYYQTCAAQGTVTDPWNRATQPYPHSVRGGSWDDDPPALRSAARRGSARAWKAQDPQLPKSVWYHSDAQFVGFRIVRPLAVPSPKEMAKYWTSGVEKD